MTPVLPAKLSGVHTDLVGAVLKILQVMDILGHPMMVTDGVRTQAQQQKLFAQGRTTPGKIVTQLDGVTKKSNHQPKADGLGRAVDCCFVVNGVPSWAETHPWPLYGAMAQSLGLVWGGAWVNFKDKPHIEMK